MARAPQRGAARASAEDDFYGEDQGQDEGQDGQDEFEGEGDRGRGEGSDVSGRAADDTGEEQETGEREALDDGFDDFFDPEPQSRGRNRHQRLANENTALANRVADLERQLNQGPRQQAPTGPQEETEQDFETRIAQLDAVQQLGERHKRFERRFERNNLISQVNAAENADRTAYELKAKTDQRYARWRDRVETERVRLLQAGQIVSRENILAFLLGQRLLNGDGKALSKARAGARERMERQTTRPVRGGSDVPSDRGRRGQLTEAQARARRLEGVQI